jgi:hypothetical protein
MAWGEAEAEIRQGTLVDANRTEAFTAAAASIARGSVGRSAAEPPSYGRRPPPPPATRLELSPFVETIAEVARRRADAVGRARPTGAREIDYDGSNPVFKPWLVG